MDEILHLPVHRSNINENRKYFIATIEKLPEDSNSLDTGDVCTVGYFNNYTDAVKRLHENTCDLHEGIYQYAVIEEVGPGLYPNVSKRQFFKYDKNKDGYFEISEPNEIKHLCNFSIG